MVATNFSGSFSCAFIDSAHKVNVIIQIASDFRNLSPREMLLIARARG
jgi:hypothetical protein